MPSIAEILANPTFTPTELIANLLRQRNGDASAVVADLASAGYKSTVNGVLRVGKKYGIIPKKTRVLKGRPAPKPFYTRFSKLMGGNIRVPGDVVRAKLRAQRKRRAAEIRPMFAGAGSLDELRSLMAGSWKKPRVARTAVPKKTKDQIRSAQRDAFVRRFTSKYGMAPEMAGRVATQVGSYVSRPKRRYGVRSMVAMNPSFNNPAFDFSAGALLGNTVSGAQTAAGAIAGLAAAKYGNQFLVAPLAKNLLKQDDAGILGRLASAFLSGTIVSTVARSFLPGDWGRKIADGAFAGAVMYVAGGIKMNDKPVLDIGALIQDSSGSLHDPALVSMDISSQVRAAIAEYTKAPAVADGMMDDMTGRGVNEYIIDPGQGDREVY